jgi:hypothetical protein
MVVDEAGSWKLRAEAEEKDLCCGARSWEGGAGFYVREATDNASIRTVSGAAILLGCVVVELCCSFVELCMHLSKGFLLAWSGLAR